MKRSELKTLIKEIINENHEAQDIKYFRKKLFEALDIPRELLNELPNIDVARTTFDLEFEKGDGIQKVYNLIMGKKLKDKHGNTLKLTTNSQIVLFALALRANSQAKKLMK